MVALWFVEWIGLDWVIKLLDWVGLDLGKWTHVQLCTVCLRWGCSQEHNISSIINVLF